MKVNWWAICFVVVPTTLSLNGCQQDANPPRNQVPAASGTPLRLYEYKRPAMGVALVIQVWCSDKEQASTAMQAADARVEKIEHVLSNYRDDSEVSELSRALTKGPVVVSTDLWRVLKQSEHGWTFSDQAFDVTIAPLTELWRAARKSGQLPTTGQIEEARQRVGFGKLKLDESRHSIESQEQPVRFDFGAIGKGDAADEALLVLKQHGIESALVELGGDMAIGSAPPGRLGWRIAVDAFSSGAAATHFIEVANCGVATSGDKHQFVEVDGVRYSHIIYPKTGMALKQSSLVTVVAPTGANADMFATVFSLLEPGAARTLADSLGDTFVRGEVEFSNGEQRIFASEAFPEMHELDPASEGEQP